jgi:putative sterol carrier protein
MSVREELEATAMRFNAKVHEDPAFKREVEGIVRKVNFDLGHEKYNFILENEKIAGVSDGLLADPDMTVLSDPMTIHQLFTGELKPMKAWALKKVRIKGSLEDILKLRKFF